MIADEIFDKIGGTGCLRPRVLVIEPAGNLWGSERALLDLLDGKPNAEFAVCCPPSRPLGPELSMRGIPVFCCLVYASHNKARWQRIRAAFGVVYACLRFRPDIIYLNQSGAFRISSLAASLLRLPVVAHVRIFEDAAYLARTAARSRNLRKIIAISYSVENELRKYRELTKISVSAIYDAYAFCTAKPAELARTAGRIACVGRIAPIKGQHVLIGALGLMEGQDYECIIAGDGEPVYMKALMAGTDSDPRVRWLGLVDEIMPLLRGCSVLVCPSHREPLGRVIFEAWDAGAVPVVYAGSGGAAEIIKAAGGGILYNDQTPECLAAALKESLALDSRSRRDLIDNGRAWTRKNCDPDSYGRSIGAILAAASGQPRTPTNRLLKHAGKKLRRKLW